MLSGFLGLHLRGVSGLGLRAGSFFWGLTCRSKDLTRMSNIFTLCPFSVTLPTHTLFSPLSLSPSLQFPKSPESPQSPTYICPVFTLCFCTLSQSVSHFLFSLSHRQPLHALRQRHCCHCCLTTCPRISKYCRQFLISGGPG